MTTVLQHVGRAYARQRRRFAPRQLVVGAMLALLMVSACSTPRIPGLPGTERPAPPPCPRVTLLDDTDELTYFRPGPGRDLTDIMFEARIADFSGECEVRRADDGRSLVDMEMTIRFDLTRGPSLAGGDAAFAYFVAIVDSRERILTKEIFDIAVRFDGRNSLIAADQAFQRMDLAPGVPTSEYIVIVGFQLDDQQVRYNRTR